MSDKVINVNEIDISGEALAEVVDKEAAPELTPEQLEFRQRMSKLMLSSFIKYNKNWKNSLKGFASGRIKPIKFWFNGKLINKEDHDKLSVDEIAEYNNVLSSSKSR